MLCSLLPNAMNVIIYFDLYNTPLNWCYKYSHLSGNSIEKLNNMSSKG